MWGIASSVGLPPAREKFMKKSESRRGMLRWFGDKGVSAGKEAEEIALTQVGNERTKGESDYCLQLSKGGHLEEIDLGHI